MISSTNLTLAICPSNHKTGFKNAMKLWTGLSKISQMIGAKEIS